jgi:hypothetical protein
MGFPVPDVNSALRRPLSLGAAQCSPDGTVLIMKLASNALLIEDCTKLIERVVKLILLYEV